MFTSAKVVLDEFRKCLALRRRQNPETFGQFNSPSSGVMITLGAIHLCEKVSVYGVGEITMKGSPYQVCKTAEELHCALLLLMWRSASDYV